MAASVPSTVAIVAVAKAIRIVTQAASRRAWLRKSSPYQRVENPPHTVTSCDALNE